MARRKRRVTPTSRIRRVRSKLRVKSRKNGVFAGLWLIITSVFLIAWLVLGGALWLTGTLLAGLATAILAVATFDSESAVTGPRPAPAQKSSPRVGSENAARRSSPGTPRRRRAAGKPRKRVCSARCRASTKPASTCDCVCGGRTHGGAGGPVTARTTAAASPRARITQPDPPVATWYRGGGDRRVR